MSKRWVIALVLAIAAVWVFVSFTPQPVHLDLARVPTVAGVAAAPAAVVEKARGVVLAHLVEENLPGVSVAVGRDGEVVWSEGFGYADLRTRSVVTPAHRFRVGVAADSAAVVDDDFPLVNMFRELIHDPEARYDPSARPVEGVTNYYPRFRSDPRYGMYVVRVGGVAATPTDLGRFGRESLDGMVASVRTVPDRGIVVAVASNISHANTAGLAARVAAIFAEN